MEPEGRLLADAAVDALAQEIGVAAVPRILCDLRHQDVAKLQVRSVGAEVGDADVSGAQVGNSGHELVGELYLGPPLPPGVLHDCRVGDRAVPVAVTVLVGAIQLRRVLAGHDPAKVSLLLGQVSHQPEQGHRGRWYRSPGKLLGVQVGALHLQRQPIPAQIVEQYAAFVDSLDIGFARVVVGSTHMSR